MEGLAHKYSNCITLTATPTKSPTSTPSAKHDENVITEQKKSLSEKQY